MITNIIIGISCLMVFISLAVAVDLIFDISTKDRTLLKQVLDRLNIEYVEGSNCILLSNKLIKFDDKNKIVKK